MKQRDQHLIVMGGPPNLFGDCLMQVLKARGYEVCKGRREINPAKKLILFLWSGDKKPSCDDLYRLRGDDIAVPLLFFSPFEGEKSYFEAPKRANMLCVNMAISIEDLAASIDAIVPKCGEIRMVKKWQRGVRPFAAWKGVDWR